MARGDLARRIRERALVKRSPAYKWLLAHHAEISRAKGVRGFWGSLLATAIEAGVTITKAGKEAPPTVAALRSAWLRVEADKAADAADKPLPAPARKDRTPPPPPPPIRPAAARPLASKPSLPDPATAADGDDAPRIIEPRSKFSLKPGVDLVKPPKGI